MAWDIGLGDWLLDMEREAEIARIVPAVLSLIIYPKAAQAKVKSAAAKVKMLQQMMTSELSRQLKNA